MTKHELTRTFAAKGEVRHGNSVVPAVVTGNYKTYEAEGVEIQLSPDMDSLPEEGFIDGDNRIVNLWGTLPNRKKIWAPDLRIDTWSRIRGKDTLDAQQLIWQGTADFFAEGDLEEFDAASGTLYYHLVTNPSPLADPGVEYWLESDGTSTLFPDNSEKQPLQWQTSIGVASFTDSFEYPTAEDVGYYQAQLRIRRFGVAIERRLERIVSPVALLEELSNMFGSAFSMISFLSRRRVDWFRVEIIYIPDDNLKRDSRKVIALRRRWLGYSRGVDERTYSYSLVRLDHLKNGLFETLLDRFESSSLRNALDGVIVHLMMSHEDVYFENRYISAFTALESLVNILAEENRVYSILDDESFRSLKRELAGVIKKTIPGKGKKEIRAALYSKLMELSRRAFIEKLLVLKDRYGLQLDELWPAECDIDCELDRLVKRRNRYLHQGIMDNFEAYFYDLNRIQNIVELWILKLLHVPEQAVNPAALGHLVPIGRYNPE